MPSVDEPSETPAAAKPSDEKPPPVVFRLSRPRHLRDDVPVPPPPDPRRAAERADSTLPMPAVEADSIGRRRPGPRAWLAAAGAFVLIVAGSFVLTTLRSSGGEQPVDDYGRLGDVHALPQPWSRSSAATTPDLTTPPPSPTPTRTNRPTRTPAPGAPVSTGATEPTARISTTTRAPAPQPTTPPAPTAPSGPTPLPITPRTGSLKVTGNGRCLDDKASDTTEGNPIQAYTCNATTAQRVNYRADGTLQILGKCVKQSGSTVQLRTCDTATASAWYFRSDKALVNKSSQQCLTVSNVSVNGAYALSLVACTNASTAQQWDWI
jgi:hypothetical protein